MRAIALLTVHSRSGMKRASLIVFLVLLADQALKVWVKLNFFYDSSISILGDKGYLHFIENRGMAFGMEFGGTWGKLMLTLLRIAAVSAIGYSLHRMVQRGASTGLVVSVSLILAGALGNIIDSTFYGVLFSASTPFEKAVFLPPDGGYAPLLHGAVVDMFYFPVWEGRLPDLAPDLGRRILRVLPTGVQHRGCRYHHRRSTVHSGATSAAQDGHGTLRRNDHGISGPDCGGINVGRSAFQRPSFQLLGPGWVPRPAH